MKGFDIIGLAETWEEPGRGRRSDLVLDGYEVRLEYAVRDKKRKGERGFAVSDKKGDVYEA